VDLEDLPAALLRPDQPAVVTAMPATPVAVAAATESGTLARTKEEAEAQRIVEALQKHANNRLRAAAELGVSRMTLYNKLRRYGLLMLI
jgi:transcriptional regulator with PAS, ATPase and Fis domain